MARQDRVEYHRSVRSPHERPGLKKGPCTGRGSAGRLCADWRAGEAAQPAIQILHVPTQSCNWRVRYRPSVWRQLTCSTASENTSIRSLFSFFLVLRLLPLCCFAAPSQPRLHCIVPLPNSGYAKAASTGWDEIRLPLRCCCSLWVLGLNKSPWASTLRF
jgi:hypothetical protein